MRLFRYFDLRGGLATLQNRTMRFASPLAFNDPFELTPRLEKPSDELLVSRLKAPHLIEDHFLRVGSKLGMSREESEKLYLTDQLPKRFQKLRSHEGWQEVEQKMKWDEVGRFADGFRILCCSHREDSILMWSHYAEKHRGIVVEFEADEMIEGTRLSDYALDVRYRTMPPSVQALHDDIPSFERDLNRMVATKALEWSYEEEVRLIITVDDAWDRTASVDRAFNPSCIKRVIVGCNLAMNSDEFQYVDQLADQADYKHVKFQRAFLDFHEYKLRFVDRVHNQ